MDRQAIWFDMDGTIADLYGVTEWLADILNEKTTPFTTAKPLCNMQSLARVLHRLQKKGYQIGICSWTSKGATRQYAEATAEAKRQWLHKHLRSVEWDYIDIIEYGTPKHEGRTGWLFDDEITNRNEWQGTAIAPTDIIGVLKNI